MFQEKSIQRLSAILASLQELFTRFNHEAQRDPRLDYKLMDDAELQFLLRSQIRTLDKKKLVLIQIGKLRINLFNEIDTRIQKFVHEHLFDDAVRLMHLYASQIAIPFIPQQKVASLTQRFMDILGFQRTPEPKEYIDAWKTNYHAYQNESSNYLREKSFAKLRMSFNMLFNMSFTDDNWPPGSTIVYYDPSTKVF